MMFGLIGRIVPTLSGAASYLPAGLTSFIREYRFRSMIAPDTI